MNTAQDQPRPIIEEQLAAFRTRVWFAIATVAAIAVFASVELVTRVTGAEQWTDVAQVGLTIIGYVGIAWIYIAHDRENRKLTLKQLASQNILVELQREAAVDRRELALNVDVSTEVINHSQGCFVKSTVRMKNASSREFCVPAVYFTVFLIPRNVAQNDSFQGTSGYTCLGTQNAAQYPNMCSIAPEEHEMFTAWYFFTPEMIAENPSVLITYEVVGGMQEGAFSDRRERAKFMNWMAENGGHNHVVFSSVSSRYDSLNEETRGILSAKRCLLSNRLSSAKEYELDFDATRDYKQFLDGTMMWDRLAIVPLEKLANKRDVE